ncbi:MAG TPA: tetratricopeptide repeat protein [Verrucomicrobiae bacterium]|nr:tetratricopeptide repeat protein [Verrucomicrobiae bacterium]
MRVRNALYFLALSVALSGCSRSYLAEKEFFKAKKTLESIKLSAPVEALEEPIAAFQHVVDRFPGTPKAMESLIAISNLRLKQKKYSEARDAMKTIVEDYSADKDRVAEARDRIGQIYQAEGNWDAAQKAYWEAAEYNPLHVRGLYAPIKILLHYKQAKDDKGFEQQFVRVLDHYQGLIKQLGPIDTAAPVKNYLAMAYMVKGDTQPAVDTWEALYREHHENGYAPMALLAAAELRWREDNLAEAERLWGLYFKDYPNHGLAGKTSVTIGMLYQGKKDFTKSRGWYNKALEQYFKGKSLERSEVELLMAKSYQDEGNWEQADTLYKQLEQDYPNTSPSLQVPLLRAEHFREAGDTEQSNKILGEAILVYQGLETENPDENVRKIATRFKTAAYAQLGAWQDMIKEIEGQMAQETQPEKKGRWLFLKALLTENRLKDHGAAIQLYENFLKDYPEHPLSSRAKAQLDALKQA